MADYSVDLMALTMAGLLVWLAIVLGWKLVDSLASSCSAVDSVGPTVWMKGCELEIHSVGC